MRLNGVVIGEFDSDSESMFTSIDVEMDQAQTVTLESIGIGESDWISLLEVSIVTFHPSNEHIISKYAHRLPTMYQILCEA